MSDNRREFLRRAGALALSGALMPRSLIAAPTRAAAPHGAGAPVRGMADPHALAAAAVDAARQAGAGYADARATIRRSRAIFPDRLGEVEIFGLGVRALVNGYWGFASSPLWTLDEAARLGRESVAQARANALGKDRPVELGTIAAASGSWASPFQTDPFGIATSEIRDWLNGYAGYASELDMRLTISASATRDERTFASSDGSACSQTLTYVATGAIAEHKDRGWPVGGVSAQGGWELAMAVPWTESIRRAKAGILEDLKLPIKPVEVGRFHLLADAASVAGLVAKTFGYATELDRALGYEANAGGTSYLNDPLAMLGSYKAGAPLLTLTAERSRPGSLATVKWDDEGVTPEPFTLVKDGVLTDYQTTRESAAWLAPWYAKRGVPVRSHGCAAAPTALDVTTQHTPNLTLHPAATEAGYEDLLAGISDGIAVRALRVSMDWQRSSGFASAPGLTMYQVKRGKRVAMLTGAGILFRSSELWRGLVALGGPKSVVAAGGQSEKGEPSQTTGYSVHAPPAVFKDVTIIDATRKA